VAALSSFLENALLDHVLRRNWFVPDYVFLALFTSATTAAGAGSEVTGGSYVRVPVAFDPPAGGQISNSGTVLFENLPAVRVTHVALTDALVGGHFLFHGPLPAPRTTEAGDGLAFSPGSLTVSLS
jgi:hypothetical protein